MTTYSRALKVHGSDMREAIIMPFHRALPWILAHPTSKKLPPGFRFGKVRHGFDSLEVFCREWRFVSTEYSALVNDMDMDYMDQAFHLLESREKNLLSGLK